MRAIRNLLTDQSGVTSVEYAVMLALIVGVCFAAISVVGDLASAFWGDASTDLGNSLNQ